MRMPSGEGGERRRMRSKVLITISWTLLLIICGAMAEMEAEGGEEEIMESGTERGFAVRSMEGRRRPVSGTPSLLRPTLRELLAQLDSVWPCRPNRTVENALAQQLLNESMERWIGHGNGGQAGAEGRHEGGAMLVALAELFSKHTYLASSGRALPPNSSITSLPPFRSLPSSHPVLGFQLQCPPDASPSWAPLALYPTSISNAFLQIRLPPQMVLNACGHSLCQTHCSYSVHGGIRVFARACCAPASGDDSGDQIDSDSALCRDEWLLPQRLFLAASAICVFFCALMIGVVVRERRRQQHGDRGWALMEPFFAGAILLYSVPLLGWPLHVPWSCWLAMLGRQLGFTLFYGSVLLKIYRNLQDYRVRKAQHVIVRELDLIIYLICAFLLISYGIVAWSAGSWARPSLWTSEWPQCPVEQFTLVFSLIELLALLYGIRLCYKARNSSWIERYQFTMAVVLEAVVSLVVFWIRYSLDQLGSRDTLFLVSAIHLHLTISVNIAAIITPKFLISSDSSRRTLGGNMTGLGNSGRAHPSLAKMRENLINGTIDFQEVPIVDMNPEDIRAELKRVYTQLRMYKLKNAYQDNPHISKRKGGGAKKAGGGGGEPERGRTGKAAKVGGPGIGGAVGSGTDRRISIPPSYTQQQNAAAAGGSPKFRKEHHGAAGGPSGRPLMAAEEEEERGAADLTVESAPHNVHLLTSNRPSGPADHSIRV